MDLISRKLELVEKLMGVINVENIEKIESFFKKEIKENNKNTTSEFPEIINELLKKSVQNSENGNVLSHDNVIQEAKERYKLS